jgi:hypothetical protein
MNRNWYTYHYNQSLLVAIPAVHHHTAFARYVHSAFRDPLLKPEAVAVELGHSLVLELVQFLRELEQGTHKEDHASMYVRYHETQQVHQSFADLIGLCCYRNFTGCHFMTYPINYLPRDSTSTGGRHYTSHPEIQLLRQYVVLLNWTFQSME